MLRALARTFNIDIHVVDSIENGANGFYKDGAMYISTESDRALEYVFAHEITHHMQQYAPQEYNELKELVRKSWAEQGGIDEAVDSKLSQYAQHDVELSREDALDEIIADSTYEVLQDENFINELCRENRNIAQSILNAIKEVLKKLRMLLADGDRFTPAQNEQLLSNLDILKDFEKKWTDGLLASVENRDAVGSVTEEAKVVKMSAKESKKDSIRLQIERNLDELNKMAPVADVKTKGYKGKSDKQVIDAVIANFKKRGYGVDRKGFGFISLEEEFINRSLNYLNTEAEYAAFDVLPQVLKNGKEIRDDEHKGRGHNTVTFAAPVVINGKAGIVGAVVMRTKGNRYKTHRIVMPDGSQYIFEREKTEVTTSGMTEEKLNGEGPDITSAVDNSISQTDQNNNGKFSLRDSDIRFSFAGDNALNADNEMLAKAKEMHNGLESSEAIRKATGWHIGADGKWRFEIDDSQMKVFVNGDALFRKNHPEYVRMQELFGKLWDGTITGTEQEELTGLNEIWGGEPARLRTRLQRGLANLSDIIQHDMLFENYPQLADVRIVVGDLGGANGAYAANGSEIKIDEDLFKDDYRAEKRNKTLIHEIQHAIQDIEEFATGANFNTLEAAVNASERRVEDADRRYEMATDGLIDALEKTGYFDKYGEDIDIADESELSRIRSEYGDADSGIGKLIDEFESSQKDFRESQQKLRELRDMSPKDFYENAAGEVEARDSANRLGYDEEGRRENRPDIDSSVVVVEDHVRFSLKNKNITPNARIPYTVHQSYMAVPKNDNVALKKLQDSVRNLKRGTYENKATGYKADIVRETVGKIINPSGKSKFNHWAKKYIDNLNAAAYLPELFQNAVYVDTKGNQKSKKANQQIRGYHHFVAPIYMDGKEYRVRIVAREKQNSDTLYIVETEVMKIKNGSSVGRRSSSRFVSVPSDISIPELVNGVKIYDYNMQQNDIYTPQDIKYSIPDESSAIDYMNEHETEFADLTGFRDYEVKAKQVRQQTYGELKAQVEKLKRDKRFTKGKVLDEHSVREEINDMIVTLMSYSESYNSLGAKKKTDHNLVREGVNAAKQIFTAMKNGDVSDVVTKAELRACFA